MLANLVTWVLRPRLNGVLSTGCRRVTTNTVTTRGGDGDVLRAESSVVDQGNETRCRYRPRVEFESERSEGSPHLLDRVKAARAGDPPNSNIVRAGVRAV